MSPSFRYKPFGILRFVLALMVMIQHFCADIAPQGIKQVVFPWAVGNVAVLGFFILSGFIICEAYHNNYQKRPLAYLKNRFVRIVPSYWAALAISIFVHFIILEHNGTLTSLDRHSIETHHFGLNNLVNNFLAIIPPVRVNVTPTEYPFIPYAWALQTEMMFYLTVFAVGAAYPFLSRFSKWPQGYWLALAAYVGIVVAAGVEMGWLPKALAYGSYFAFGGALFFFLAGYRKACFVLVPALMQMMWHFHSFAAENFTEIPANRSGQLFLLILILFAVVILATLKTERTKLDKWVGEFSYPLYLNHYVVGVVILNTVNDFSLEYLLTGAWLSLALSGLMFWLVDKPLIRVRRAIRQRNGTAEIMVSSDP